MSTTIQEAIFYGRARIGLTQKELARAVGVSTRTVYGWEQGTSVPREKYLLRIKSVLGLEDRRLTVAKDRVIEVCRRLVYEMWTKGERGGEMGDAMEELGKVEEELKLWERLKSSVDGNNNEVEE